MTKDEALDQLLANRNGYKRIFATPAGKVFIHWLEQTEVSMLETALKAHDRQERLSALDKAAGIRTVREHLDAMMREFGKR